MADGRWPMGRRRRTAASSLLLLLRWALIGGQELTYKLEYGTNYIYSTAIAPIEKMPSSHPKVQYDICGES